MKVSPAPLASFLGTSDSVNTIPPDGGGAVGPNHVFAAQNHVFVIRNKTGALISAVSPVTFFSGLIPGFSADPHVKYDQYNSRWIVVGQSETDTVSSIVIAVSQTNDPTGNYNRYVFRIDPVNGQVADFPLLGYNKRWIVVTTNLFSSDISSFTGTSLFVLDKATLYSGGALNFSTNAFRQLSGTPDGSNPCPVTTFSDGSIGDEMYLLQSWNATAGRLRLTKISGSLPNLTWPSNAIFPQFASGWTYDGGDIAPQLDDTRKINTGDARMHTLVERNGLLWACHNIFINGRAVIQWMQLSPTGNIIQAGKITTGPSTVFRAYPSLAVTEDESVLIGYTRFSPTTYASAAYSYRNAGTPVNTLDSEFVYKNGLSAYYKTFGGGRNRWGDYSSTAVDPVTGRLWTIQEIADQRTGSSENNSRFATWWAQVIPDFANVNIDAALTAVINPLIGNTFCNSVINPKITLRNNGTDTLKTATITMLLDGSPIGSAHNFTGSITPFESIDITLNSFTASTGSHTLKIFSANPNGLVDQRVINDTISVTFLILQTLALPATQGFESATFPPAGGWAVFNSDGDVTWGRTTSASKTGSASMTISGFDYPSLGETDIFKSPKIDVTNFDSLYVSFDVAYAKLNDEDMDTLEVVYSVDCGITWLPTGYKKWGTALATNGGDLVGDAFIPTLSQWRNDTAKISKCKIGSNNILVGIKFVNDFGQNCYIDNIKIQGIALKQRNAQLVSINKPSQTFCATGFTPEVTISNQGSDTLKTLTIHYQVDGGQLATFNFTGSLARCSQQVVTLNAVTSNVGPHTLTIYVTDPNNTTDQYPLNDTLHLTFTISGIEDAPVTEGFENTIFPPGNWGVLNPDGSLTWERTIAAANTGVASMVIRNFNNPAGNTIDKFISPIVNIPATADSVFVSFDYAYAPGGDDFPGNTIFPIDTFEIQLTQNCGETFTTIWKKWGEDLHTVDELIIPFVPESTSWRNVKLYLSPFINNQSFQVYFVAKGNKQNYLYVDNINVYAVALPARLKNQGYLIYPNPSSGSILVQHYQPPVDLKAISVYSSTGQLVWQKQYSGNANSQITLNLSHVARGVYSVKLNYTDRTIVERIIKD